MERLQTWLDENDWDDARFGEAIGVSRVQASRIRRGLSGASRPVAEAIQKLTGIEWHEFIAPKSAAVQSEGVTA